MFRKENPSTRLPIHRSCYIYCHRDRYHARCFSLLRKLEFDSLRAYMVTGHQNNIFRHCYNCYNKIYEQDEQETPQPKTHQQTRHIQARRLPQPHSIRKLPLHIIYHRLETDICHQFVFSIAAAKFHPSNNFSYLALAVELPAILFCVEMAIISVFFHLVYSAKPYTNNGATTQSRYQGGPLGIAAIGTALNPIDIGRGIVDGF